MTEDQKTQNTIAKILIFAGLANLVFLVFSIGKNTLTALGLIVVAAGFMLYVSTDARGKQYLKIVAVCLYAIAGMLLIKTLLGR